MRPGTVMWALAMFEMMRAIWIIKRYSKDCNIDEALPKMSLNDFMRIRSHLMCTFGLCVTAQIMWWLP